jgi:hypothetical protein
MTPKWFKQRSIQDLEIQKTRKFPLNIFDLIFLGWGLITFFVTSHAIFTFKFPFMG